MKNSKINLVLAIATAITVTASLLAKIAINNQKQEEQEQIIGDLKLRIRNMESKITQLDSALSTPASEDTQEEISI